MGRPMASHIGHGASSRARAGPAHSHLDMDVEEEASVSMAEEDGEEDADSLALGPQVPLKDHLQLLKACIIPHLASVLSFYSMDSKD